MARTRGEITLNILKAIAEFSGNASDHVLAFLTAGYGASVSRVEWEASKHRKKRERQHAHYLEEKRIYHRYQAMATILKDEGLIEQRSKNGRALLSLTARGHLRLKKLQREIERLVRASLGDAPWVPGAKESKKGKNR